MQLARNVLDQCIIKGGKKVSRKHVLNEIIKDHSTTKIKLSENERSALAILMKFEKVSASDDNIRKQYFKKSRSTLRKAFVALEKKGIAFPIVEGHTTYYSVLPIYKKILKKRK